MSDLVGNPEDRFSGVAAHWILDRHVTGILSPSVNIFNDFEEEAVRSFLL